MDFYNKNTVVQKLILGIRNLSALLVLILTGVFIWLIIPTNQKVSDLRMAENPWPIASFIEATNPTIEVRKGYQLLTTEASRWESSKGLSSNRLACTNCHLNAGTQNGAASFLGVTSRYPKFSGRDGKISDLADRVNGCMERSMNRKPLNKNSPEMTAMLAYMQWLDQNYTTLEPHQAGFVPIRIPNRAVDLQNGAVLYQQKCALCHGQQGEGIQTQGRYQYPPLWGKEAYNEGAGMHRILTAAAFIKANMPYLEAHWKQPKLSDEEAFDLAGYINSKKRPSLKKTKYDYPENFQKPVSTPYGPWVDPFSAEQHKYGPFPPIIQFYQKTFNTRKKY